MIGTVRAIFTILTLALFTLPLIPVQILFNKFNLPGRQMLPVIWHRFAAYFIGLKVTVTGEMAADRPLLITSNHISWLDIVALGGVGPVSFIAKKEVSDWPVFGKLAQLQNTVFINRERKSDTNNKTGEIANRLKNGDAMILFAEGTSTSGTHVLPFRSALLGAIKKAARSEGTIWVQSVALAYTHLHGMRTVSNERAVTGFYGDMEMAPHLWRILQEAAVDVSIIYGEAHPVTGTTNRKVLTKILEDEVRIMKTRALRGSDITDSP